MLVGHMLPEAYNRLATVQADDDLTQVARLLSLEHINAVLVCDDDGRMIGIVTDSDIVRCLANCRAGETASKLPATEAMTSDVVSCQPEAVLSTIWPIMRDRYLRHIPIIDLGGKPLGVLYARDVLKHLLDETREQERELEGSLMGVYP